MKIEDFFATYPERAAVLDLIESDITKRLLLSKYKGPIKLIDSFVWLFTDDLKSTVQNVTTDDLQFILYSEAFKRIRSSFLLSIKGYFVDCSALLRSVFELNKANNAIQNGVLTAENYLSGTRPANFRTLPQKEQEDAINDHIRDVDNLVNGYDDKGLPPNVKESLRIFKSNLHTSVHKALGSIALNLKEFRSGSGGNLFKPFDNLELFEICINNFSFLILMFLRNFLRSAFVNPANKQKLQDIAAFIESIYASVTGYHKDILDYVVAKY